MTYSFREFDITEIIKNENKKNNDNELIEYSISEEDDYFDYEWIYLANLNKVKNKRKKCFQFWYGFIVDLFSEFR